MQANLAAVVTGYGLQDATAPVQNEVLKFTLDSGTSLATSHTFLFSDLPSFLPASVPIAEVQPILNFLASPESGIIMGDLGPFIAPWVELGNSITAGDDFGETLANMAGAFFNGADLSLNSLIPLIDQAGVFPAGLNLENLDIAFGGLLSPGEVTEGVGGSIFNSLGVELTGVPILNTIDLTGQAVGPLGALEGWTQALASLLGWDGSGSPLADITLPIIPTDLLDGGTAAATAAADLLDGGTSAATMAADLSTLWQDLLAAF
jgi:hypothetical protein